MSLLYAIDIGPFSIGLSASMPAMLSSLEQNYPGKLSTYKDQLVDFELAVKAPNFWRRWFRPNAQFYWDAQAPFHPVPGRHAPLAFEWGLNFAIAKSANQYILLHSAVLAKDGEALIMPAPPGAGKSTLTAALMLSGWQLLSDEFAIIEPATQRLLPLPRPISLKNRSIDIIRSFAGAEAVFSERYKGTKKGDISLLAVDKSSRGLEYEAAKLRWIVLPRWVESAATQLLDFPRGQSLMVLADNAFNLGLHGESGFQCLCDLVAGSDCYELTYSQLDQGVGAIEGLRRRC